ncbi:MAG: AI-2E family transporter [Bacteroidota bacterium]
MVHHNEVQRLAKLVRTLIILALIGFGVYLVKSIVIYTLVALFLFLMVRPIREQIVGKKLWGWRMPKWLGALAGVLAVYLVVLTILGVLIPVMVNNINEAKIIEPEQVRERILEFSNTHEQTLQRFGVEVNREDLETEKLVEKVKDFVGIGTIQSTLKSIASTLLGVFTAIASITVLLFFMLIYHKAVAYFILFIVPQHRNYRAIRAYWITSAMTRRFIVGFLSMAIILSSLVGLGASLGGVPNVGMLMVIAFFSMAIPYVGPPLGFLLNTVVIAAGGGPVGQHLLIWAGIFLVIQAIDNWIMEPFIYGKSLQASPMEIILVLFLAGALAGVPGMIGALPVYLMLRTTIKAFYYKNPLMRKLPGNYESAAWLDESMQDFKHIGRNLKQMLIFWQ